MGDERAVFITLFCKNCNEPRYRSVKALRVGQDKLDAHSFQPVAAGIPQPDPTGPAKCPFCEGLLSIVKEAPMAEPASPDQMAQARVDAVLADKAAREMREAYKSYQEPLPTVREVTDDLLGVAELFRLEGTEEMVSVQDLPTKILIVTSKRVVAVSK